MHKLRFSRCFSLLGFSLAVTAALLAPLSHAHTRPPDAGAFDSLALVPVLCPPPCGDAGPVPQPNPSQFAWIYGLQNLSAAALTVRAQTVSPNDDGRLMWDLHMPRVNVDSTKISDITRLDFRPVSDRRAWNARGRRIPLLLPKKRDYKIHPIEANFRIDEEEMNDHIARFMGNEALVRQLIGADIPARTLVLAMANYNRVETDTHQAWADSIVTVRDPETDQTYDVEFPCADERRTEAGVAWDDPSVNAYDELIAWLNDAPSYIGPIAGIACRLKVRTAVLKDAPTLAGGAKMSLAQLEDRIQQDLSAPFRFYLKENTSDKFVDGGIQTNRTSNWPVGKVAAIPADMRVGNNAFAPVARAMTLNNQNPNAGIDVRGNSVFMLEENGGRELDVECQINVLPVPDENRIYVRDTGIVG